MSNTKYTPLEDDAESVNLPPYELNTLKSPEVDPYQTSKSTFSDSEATSHPTSAVAHFLDQFSSWMQDEFEKSYSFKIKSATIDEGVFRFHYFPKKGIEGFRKVIENKIEYTTQSSSCSPFAIGYFDQHNDLITINNDQDLLECIHWNNVTYHKSPSAIKLISYDIRNHATVAKQFKMAEKRKCAIIGVSVVLSILLVVLFIFGAHGYFS